ncbi:LacI family transcriptional regulator OS=Streptomyces albaduncus OX=68172 GN=FHS32_002386 PE=4 SV=1 [Streptomyces griseoloalbus]
MGHPFPIREIARQAGLSEATVDRVLNGRGGVRESTAREVHQHAARAGREPQQAVHVVLVPPPRPSRRRSPGSGGGA